MSVVPVTINGVAYPKDKMHKPYPVTIVGYAWITGLQVGGGPMPGGPGQPPGSGDAHPEHPIVLPPENPDDPPHIWGGGNEPFPTPPIVIPPDQPPPDHPLEELFTMVAKAPPPEGGWGWFPEYGWVYSPGEESAQPKRPR